MNDERVPLGNHPFRWGILSGVWLAYFGFSLTAVTIAPLVPQIGADLNLSNSRIGSVMGAWQLVYIFSAIPCGIFLHRVGARRSLLIAFFVIALSGASRAFSYDHLSLFLAVALFGLGGPLVSIGAPKLISLWFAGKERGLAMGIYMTGMAMGSMAGLSLTHSVMMPALDNQWRDVLLAYSGFVLVAGLVWFAISSVEVFKNHERALKIQKQESQLRAFKSLIRVPSVFIVLIMSIGIFFYLHGLDNWLPGILVYHGMDDITAGYWASGPTLVGILASLIIPRLATPPRRLVILFGLFVSSLVSTLLLQSDDTAFLLFAVVLQGISKGGMMVLAIMLLFDLPEVGNQRSGLAGGLFFTFAEIGGVLGPLSMGILSDYSGGFSTPLWVQSLVCVLMITFLYGFSRIRK